MNMTKEKVEELRELYEKSKDEYDKEWKVAMDKPSWEESEAHIEEPLRKMNECRRQYDLVREYQLGNIPKYGDHMTMKEFKECVDSGGFIDYDGYANYATADQCSNIALSASTVKKNLHRKDFTHVVWYNK